MINFLARKSLCMDCIGREGDLLRPARLANFADLTRNACSGVEYAREGGLLTRSIVVPPASVGGTGSLSVLIQAATYQSSPWSKNQLK